QDWPVLVHDLEFGIALAQRLEMGGAAFTEGTVVIEKRHHCNACVRSAEGRRVRCPEKFIEIGRQLGILRDAWNGVGCQSCGRGEKGKAMDVATCHLLGHRQSCHVLVSRRSARKLKPALRLSLCKQIDTAPNRSYPVRI